VLAVDRLIVRRWEMWRRAVTQGDAVVVEQEDGRAHAG
jgi:hypothetical protein